MSVIDQPRGQTISSGLRIATSGELDRLKDVLARAFEDDPVFGWLMPDEATRRERLRRFFEIELRQIALARGVVWTTQEPSGGALCMPPGAWRVPARVLFRQGPSFARAFGARLPRATGLLTMIERRHIREPHYYFAYIGVAPEAQGHGLGTLLMRPTLKRCDSEG
jgi:GNAT superfamily N-acetyltransferase